ncbi:thioesterase family protein [Pseudomonas sp. B21-056]|jgi:carnitine 3-dehydrogenase|uniref:thioesterase family protein n=1 Tax=Pseudomonas sp. B21-056 TaxID=2895495 RepID=UPI0022303075|nr:thioesterase family protein [Pseudomonas sp. B21-056]UZE26365.1 thioesterase family protein [Pseudomonas sp. B21-056]
MPRQNFLATAEDDLPQGSALKTLEVTVLESWIDYNGHMTEWQYYRLLADAGEVLLRAIGFSEEYRLKGYSFFNVQGQQRNLRECRKDTPLVVFSEIIGFDHTRLHLYQYIIDTNRNITVATGEHMMLHVDTTRRCVTPMEPSMYDSLVQAFERLHPALQPKGLGVPFINIDANIMN